MPEPVTTVVPQDAARPAARLEARGAKPVRVENLSVVIGPSTPVNPETGRPATPENQLTPNERLYTPDAFKRERNFVLARLTQALHAPARVDGESPEAIAKREQAQAFLKKLAEGKNIEGDDWDSFQLLEITYHPLIPDEKGRMPPDNRAEQWQQVIEYYFGAGAHESIKNPDNTDKTEKFKRGEALAMREAALQLGFLTTETHIDESHWLVQLFASIYGLEQPIDDQTEAGKEQETARLTILHAIADKLNTNLANTGEESGSGRALLTPEDFDPKAAMWQELLIGQHDRLVDLEEGGLGKFLSKIKKWPLIRIFVQNRLQGKIGKLQASAKEATRAGNQDEANGYLEQARALLAENAGMETADTINKRATQAIQAMGSMYSSLPSQREAVQEEWTKLMSTNKKELQGSELVDKLKRLAAILGFQNIDDALMQFDEPGQLESFVYKGGKFALGLGLFASVLIIMQLYNGAKSGEGERG